MHQGSPSSLTTPTQNPKSQITSATTPSSTHHTSQTPSVPPTSSPSPFTSKTNPSKSSTSTTHHGITPHSSLKKFSSFLPFPPSSWETSTFTLLCLTPSATLATETSVDPHHLPTSLPTEDSPSL